MMLIFQHNQMIPLGAWHDKSREAVTSSSRDVTGTIPPVTRVAAVAVRPNQIQRVLVQACVNVGECK
jgi:hypothetical protein